MNRKRIFTAEKMKIPNKVGAKTRPCFTLILILNESVTIVLNSCIRVGVKRLYNLKEAWRAANRQQYYKQYFPTYYIELERSMKAIYQGTFCSLHL